ncbi:MAG: hypothetical protein IPK46_13355 [Saprospiraceae bacterium]|nr:hypothetical protein [Saprospiraceae bacterium]
MRDGLWQVIAGRELVPGDIVKMSEGDRMAADLQSWNLRP